MPSTLRVRSEDLKELRADLEAVEIGLGREVAAMKREAAGLVSGRAARFSQTTPGRITGELAGSLKPRGATVVTTVPQGPVHEFGGTIAPRGTPFRIARSAFTAKAGERERARIERRLAQRVDGLLERHL
jgi:hypothetical protein